MQRFQRVLRELWIVVRSVWLNFALFGLMLVVAAELMRVFGCYPGSGFHERLVNALYMSRLESVPSSGTSCLPSILVFIMPFLTLLILGEGVLRVGTLYLGRKHRREEWEQLMVNTLSGHTVLCGAGELGRALLEELLRREPHVEVVIVDMHAGVLEELGMHGPNLHHIHGDMTSQETLAAANVKSASTIVLTSGDDAHNLEGAFKALRLNPQADIWIRLYRSGLSEMMDTVTHPNVHFFSPYKRSAETLASQLTEKGSSADEPRQSK